MCDPVTGPFQTKLNLADSLGVMGVNHTTQLGHRHKAYCGLHILPGVIQCPQSCSGDVINKERQWRERENNELPSLSPYFQLCPFPPVSHLGCCKSEDSGWGGGVGPEPVGVRLGDIKVGNWPSGSMAIPVIIRERGRQTQEGMMMMRHGVEVEGGVTHC